MNRIESPSSWDALCKVCLKLAYRFRRRFLNSLFRNYLPIEKGGPFIWKNSNSLHPRIFCAKFGWNWLSGTEKNGFLNFVDLFFISKLSPFRNRTGPFIWTNLNPLHPKMLCVKFSWNWLSGSWEEVENWKSLQTDGQTDGRTDGQTDRQTDRQMTDGRQSEKLTWAFSSGDLKTLLIS